MTSRIYEYGLLPPTLGADLVDEQIWRAHRYRNVLVEIERERRAKVREILSGHADTAPLAAELAKLTAERDRLRQQIRLQRGTTRSRSESAEDRAKVRDLGARCKELRAQLKAAKAGIASDPQIQAALTAAEEHSRKRVREARAACGVYWGTYLLVEEDADRARKAPTDPRFVRWGGGEGRVSVQLQGGIDPDEIETDTKIQIVDGTPPVKATKHLDRYKVLRLRIGSAGRAPIWAEWPLKLDRPLPEGARIKRATVVRRRRDCRRWDWRLQILLDMTDVAERRPTPMNGAGALNLGWARRGDGSLRAGYLVGDDGEEREIVLPRSILDRLEQADSIRSIRDRALDAMRPALVTSIAAIAAPPPWLVERCQWLGQWRSAERFHALARAWHGQRFDGDEGALEILDSWRYRDEHLQRYEAGLARGALLHRRDTYRIVAAEMAARYRMLVVDDTDLRQLQRSPAPESERTEINAAKLAQRRAAGSELRAALVNAFGTRRVAILPAQDVTRRCFDCGSIEQWDRAASGRKHTCSGCGGVWDQDANACRNLLREWSRVESEWETSRAAKEAQRKESRSERLQRARRKAA